MPSDSDVRVVEEDNAFLFDGSARDSEKFSFKFSSSPVSEGAVFARFFQKTPVVSVELDSLTEEEKKDRITALTKSDFEKQWEDFFSEKEEGVYTDDKKRNFRRDRNQGFVVGIISDLRDKIEKDTKELDKLKADIAKQEQELRSATNISKSMRLKSVVQAMKKEQERMQGEARLHVEQLAFIAKKAFDEEQEHQAKIEAEFETVNHTIHGVREALESGMTAIFTIQNNGRRKGGFRETIRPEDQPEDWVNKWLKDLNSIPPQERADQIREVLRGSFEAIRASGIMDTTEWQTISRNLVENLEFDDGFSGSIAEDNIEAFIEAFINKINKDKKYSLQVVGALTSIIRATGKANGVLSSLLKTLEKKRKDIEGDIKTTKELSSNRREQISSLRQRGESLFGKNKEKIKKELDTIDSAIKLSKVGEKKLDLLLKFGEKQDEYFLEKQKDTDSGKEAKSDTESLGEKDVDIYSKLYNDKREAIREELIARGYSEEDAKFESGREADSWLEKIIKFLFNIPRGEKETEEENRVVGGAVQKVKDTAAKGNSRTSGQSSVVHEKNEDTPQAEPRETDEEITYRKRVEEIYKDQDLKEGQSVGDVDPALLARNFSKEERETFESDFKNLQDLQQRLEDCKEASKIMQGLGDVNLEEETFIEKLLEREGDVERVLENNRGVATEFFECLKQKVEKEAELQELQKQVRACETEIEKMKKIEEEINNVEYLKECSTNEGKLKHLRALITEEEKKPEDRRNQTLIGDTKRMITALQHIIDEKQKREELQTKVGTKNEEMNKLELEIKKEANKVREKIRNVVEGYSVEAGGLVEKLNTEVKDKEESIKKEKQRLIELLGKKTKEIKTTHKFRNMVAASAGTTSPVHTPTAG